jgi:hypothetical protein
VSILWWLSAKMKAKAGCIEEECSHKIGEEATIVEAGSLNTQNVSTIHTLHTSQHSFEGVLQLGGCGCNGFIQPGSVLPTSLGDVRSTPTTSPADFGYPSYELARLQSTFYSLQENQCDQSC